MQVPKLQQRSQVGFTLIELIVTLGIIMILFSAAVPQFDRFLTEQRRSDGHHLLLSNAARLERCLTLAGSYVLNCNLKTESQEGYYELENQRTANSWTLTARPTTKNRQDLDSSCSSMTLTHTGAKNATGTAPDLCW